MAFTDRFTRCWAIFALNARLQDVGTKTAEADALLKLKHGINERKYVYEFPEGKAAAQWIDIDVSLPASRYEPSGKNFAFAIVQYQSCWCSDVAPAASSEADVEDKCNDICPGYDTEKCGSRPNWYGYIQLSKTPTSTAGGDAATTSAAAASTTQTTTTSRKPQTSVQTVTADGTVRTVTVTPTATGTDGATGASELSPSSSASSSNGLSTGAVVGVVVGVIAAVVAFAGLGLFLFFRRRKQHQENEKYDEPSHRGSSAGMTGSPRNPEMVVTVDGGRWDADSTSDHRRSRLMAHDPRMEPLGRGLYLNNKSAESINTLRDDQDYSRKVHKPVLRATNPDPE
ncbi:hypothetical protein COL26b_002516 [Colletotrichum chrysophilum]|uniref:uncharacterized protein n=1 Tax=Colletotrichum chrysophilum TaxID=1836956 RepID=UPI002301E35D|nr:uncharacterized protein COL26b_002516 [Colletotrichum chrysophilum]KAJ0349307.1 hypothetical protein KNSL1_004767 [Colletotrichum chrysophilum]KAJ0379347.1 hypothetical protein COL26b_002516 [Colletotrichum chrysophilum]